LRRASGIFWPFATVRRAKIEKARPSVDLINRAKIDSAILAVSEISWRKVAMIIAKTADTLSAALPQGEHGYRLVAKRIEALVRDGQLVAQGDIKKWRYSEVRRSGLFYFLIHATPATSSNLKKYGGAHVSCWVHFPHHEGALALAKHYLRKVGWRVEKIEEVRWTIRADMPRKSLQYFDEAAKDGSSFVIHTYPSRSKRKRAQAPSSRKRG
jgi:hypothetical protein